MSAARLNAAASRRSTVGQVHSLAAQEEEVQPQPGEHQHDEGDGEAEDEPGAEVDHLGVRVATAGETGRESVCDGCVGCSNRAYLTPHWAWRD